MLLCSEGVVFSKQGEIYIFMFSFKEASFPLSLFPVANSRFIVSDVHHPRRTLLQLQIAAAVDTGFFALISWVVYRIDLSLPQVVTLGKNSRGYHYILANLVSNNPSGSQRGEQDLPYSACEGTWLLPLTRVRHL